jgi:hypothetical protein
MGALAVGVLYELGKPRVSVSSSSIALVDVKLHGVGATLRDASASLDGQAIPLVDSSGGLVPDRALAQGQKVTITVDAAAPSWLTWLFGKPASTTTTVQTPSAAPAARVAVASSPGHVQLRFDAPVSEVRYSFDGQEAKLVHLSQPSELTNLEVPSDARGGSLVVTAAAASWEQLAADPSTVSYFVAPPGGAPVALVSPTPGSTDATSNTPITLTFDQPVSEALGTTRPTVSPDVPGSWTEPAPNILVFTPSGFGYGPGAQVTVSFDRTISPVGADSVTATTAATTTSDFSFDVGPGSLLRLDEMLAHLHYLPLDFVPSAGASQPTSMAGEVAAMTDPVPGNFEWRWANTPQPLMSKWTVGSDNELLKGALMAFLSNQPDYDGYIVEPELVSQLVTPTLWQELIHADLANEVDPSSYAYVYVTESLPETLTLWENGSVVLTSAANTGIPGRATALGTYPIYVRYTVNYMDGTNPDGTKYHDLVHWINYFSGGDAVHGFVRGSYGYPQSLGCIELPVSTAQTAFSDLAVGDLVTVTPA